MSGKVEKVSPVYTIFSSSHSFIRSSAPLTWSFLGDIVIQSMPFGSACVPFVSIATHLPALWSPSTNASSAWSDGSPPVSTTNLTGSRSTKLSMSSRLIVENAEKSVSQKGQRRLQPEKRMNIAAVPLWKPSPCRLVKISFTL